MRRFGQFVVARFTDTGVFVRPGDVVSVVSTEKVNFGGGVFGAFEPVLTADGDGPGNLAPGDYPAPHLVKNSLLISVGGAAWRQGRDGETRFTVPAGEEGTLRLNPNDAHQDDNRDGWHITVTVTARDPYFELPHPRGSGSLLQDPTGALAFVHQGTTESTGPGNLYAAFRDGSLSWRHGRAITDGAQRNESGAYVFPPTRERAYQDPSWIQGTDGWFWGIARHQGNAVCFGHSPSDRLRVPAGGTRPVVVTAGCGGAPSITQSRWGQRGNFELAVPLASGGLAHFFADTSGYSSAAVSRWFQERRFLRTGSLITTARVSAARILHALHYENLEVLAVEQGPSGPQLAHYWGTANDWRPGGVLPGSVGAVTGVPAFVQTMPSPGNPGGDLVVVCPGASGGLLMWTRPGLGPWRGPERVGGMDTTRFAAAHLAQGHFRAAAGNQGNLELVAETALRHDQVGTGPLHFAWRDNSAATPRFSSLVPIAFA